MAAVSDEQSADWPSLMPAVAECVARLGEAGFDEALLTLLRRAVGIEQCMVFAFDGRDEVDCLLADNQRAPQVAGRLAELYTGGLFRQDPNYQRLRQLMDRNSEDTAAEVTPMQAGAMPEAYRSHLFAFPDLIDKVALTLPGEQSVYYLNLYRGSAAGPFERQDLARLDALAPLLASLIRRHYDQARPDSPQRPSAEEVAILAPLSERERQLCLYLLRGHTLKTAAAELDIALSTAETYRKRAYAKLGVPSKARLVALCRRR
ncbi:LuxR family transcriptional regulator [Billgrantia diversa]|uniref:LuxR C-terminal-related transcriptional regulator n=1 Tax=Halomonas sp. MCCC 1A13316 TaxID=2733487 RepID=UPI0018A42355|nr:LuxR C-terminal-related transcriptional regulator [Halomonas sp. MCCC 1A13316]QOR37112.1 LuxR family transcriptional regulator [Halomonas sp. MCCC 1A13316]